MIKDQKFDEILEELEKDMVDTSNCVGKYRTRLMKELETCFSMNIDKTDILTLVDSLDDVVGWEYYGLSKVTT